MKTTELFVEQVIIGFLVLTIGAMIVSADAFQWIRGAAPGTLALQAISAYLVGIAYDRFGDTLLSPMEKHHRLQFALGVLHANSSDDPFPEQDHRIRVLKNARASEYADYLRSRIRLTRAAATLTPGVAVGVGVHVAEFDTPVRVATLVLTVAVYVAGFFSAHARSKDLPRTDQLAADMRRNTYLQDHGLLTRVSFSPAPKRTKQLTRFVWRNDNRSVLFASALVGMGVVACYLGWGGWSTGGAPPTPHWNPTVRLARDLLPLIPTALFAVASLAATVLFWWSWWRISETFFQFLHDVDGFEKRQGEGERAKPGHQ